MLKTTIITHILQKKIKNAIARIGHNFKKPIQHIEFKPGGMMENKCRNGSLKRQPDNLETLVV